MERTENAVKNGYLYEDFRLFHLKDNLGDEKEYHYHEFDKVVTFLSGNVSYIIEGITYPLQPGDMLLIKSHTLHKALIDTSLEYERIIIYISPEFIDRNNTDGTNLMECFKRAEAGRFYLLRPGIERWDSIKRILLELERELGGAEYGSDISARITMLRFLIQLNRCALAEETALASPPVYFDPKIAAVIAYINENLDGELSVGELASRCFISKYHFMRKFKEQTGYTVHSYILQKRLLFASELIKSGSSPSEAAAGSGFKDYSTFQRAFKKMFGINPGKMK